MFGVIRFCGNELRQKREKEKSFKLLSKSFVANRMYYSYKGVQISGEICSPPLTPKDGLPTDTGTVPLEKKL